MSKKFLPIALIFSIVTATPTALVAQTPFIGMGDSIGEAVQSADANLYAQPYSFINLMAWAMGVSTFPLPLINTGPFESVMAVGSRSRVDPSVLTFNLAVSGADVHDLLYTQANATSPAAIDSETDLVLYPRLGSQMEIAESLDPDYIAIWIGNNDALSTVISFSNLDASQLTPIDAFWTDFAEIASRVKATGAKAVAATIPDVTDIAVLVTQPEVTAIFGTNYGMPADNLTTIPTVLMVALGLEPTSRFSDPNYLLSPTELATIRQRILIFNLIIRQEAWNNGIAVARMDERFAEYAANGLNYKGVALNANFLGGMFSLDAVHPGNFAQGIITNEFLKTFNQSYGTNFPLLDDAVMQFLFDYDPFIDKNGNGSVPGRPFVGLLETAGWLLGITGDNADYAYSSGASSSTLSRTSGELSQTSRKNKKGKVRLGDKIASNANKFFNYYKKAYGDDIRDLSPKDRRDVFRKMFGYKTLGAE